MIPDKKLHFHHLLKENKDIKPVLWKKGLFEETQTESQMLSFLKSRKFNVPNILFHDSEKIIMDFIPGVTVFSALQYFYRNNQSDKIEILIECLCEGVVDFQSNTSTLANEIVELYPVRIKLEEVFQLLLLEKLDLKTQKTLIDMISNIYNQKSSVLFRDATPKNYILNGVYEKDLEYISTEELISKITWIDFSTTRYLAPPADDFASVIFHYMVEDKFRDKMLSKYNNGFDKDSLNVTIFVRWARFWVRRFYYETYNTERFGKRYTTENMNFYKTFFHRYLQIMCKML